MSTEIVVSNDIININVTEETIIIESPSGAYPLPNNVYTVFGRTGNIIGQEGDYNLTLLGDVTITTPSSGQVLRYNGTNWANSTESYVGTVTSVAATVPTGLTISGSPITTAGTLAFGLATGYSIPTTASQTTWDTAYNRSLTSAAVTGTTTKTLTLNQQNGGTITASWSDLNTDAVTSVFGRTGSVIATEGDYSLTQLSDVTLTSPANGQVLRYNGTSWVNTSLTDYVPYTGATNDLNLGTKNLLANNVFLGFNSIAASGTQVVLTVASVPSYIITGSGGQTIKLPDATTLPNGANYIFNNNQSSGAILVNNNSNTLVVSIPSGGYCTLELTDNSIAAGSWDRHFEAPSNVTWSTNTLDYAGSITNATWNGNVIQPNRGGTGQSTYTDGQLLIGNSTGNTLSKSTLTSGTGIAITNGGGSISIASTITQYTDALARASISLTTTGTSGAATYSSSTGVLNIPQYSGGSGMVYPAAGIALSTGTAWGTSITDNSANWNTAYTNRITSLTTTGTGVATLVSNVLNIPDYTYTLPTASSTVLGGVKIGTGVTITSGVISVSTNYQAPITLTTTGTSGAATLVGSTLNIPQYAGSGGTPGGADTQIQFNNASAFGGSANFTWNTTTNKHTIGGSQTASAGVAQSTIIQPTLVAAANSDVLIGLDINPTYTNGAFTGLEQHALRISSYYTFNSQVKIGGLELQSYSLGNGWIGENMYYNGSNFTYRNTGKALLFYFYGGEGQFRSYASGTAGSNPTGNQTRIKFDELGNFAAGGTLNDAQGSYTGANLLLNSTGNLGIGTITIGSKLQVNGNAAIGYSASTAAPTNGLAISGNMGVGTTSPNISSQGANARVLTVQGLSGSNGGFEVGATGGLTAATLQGFYGFTNPSITGGLIAYIGSALEGTNGSATMGGNITFNTKPQSGTLGIRMTILGSGSIGIGTQTIGSLLQVNGNAAIGYSASTAAPTNGLSVAGTTNIGTNTSVTTALLQVSSTTQGFLPPVMTTTQKNAITSPATGLVVFDSTLGKLCVFSTTWQTITSV